VSGRLLTARALAERFEVCPATVLRWARRGELPSIRLPSGAIRFREDVVEARLDAWTEVAPRAVGVAGVLSLAPNVEEEGAGHAR
jgi:predicted site-specific integrase-resolvase